METELVHMNRIALNMRNPRTISDKKFDQLVLSLLSFPKMLSIRPITVDENYVALGGNMRYRALSAISQMTTDEIEAKLLTVRKYNKMSETEQFDLIEYWEKFLRDLTVEVIKADSLTSAELDEFVIKDNVGFGDWNYDELANDFDENDLEEWGLDIPVFEESEEPIDKKPKGEPSNECPSCGHLW